jgi:3-methyl-2-oxobutanoate hydroxymethyltransferase
MARALPVDWGDIAGRDTQRDYPAETSARWLTTERHGPAPDGRKSQNIHGPTVVERSPVASLPSLVRPARHESLSRKPGDPMNERKKVTVPDLGRWRESGRRISMITAYDALFARIVDEAGIDVILVGDSLGMVVQGHSNTIPVDLSEMIYHTRNVARAGTKALVVGDLPFGSYQASAQQAVESSIALTKAGAECVKLEGGVHMADSIAAISRVDIPVMAHIGLTPQSFHRMGGHKVQGRTDGYEAGGRNRLLEDAHAVEEAGACAVVIEGVPMDLAAEITMKVGIPTIGIGAGISCNGQVLVLHDVLGLVNSNLKFVKHFADLRTPAIDAVRRFVDEVGSGEWPDADHSFK